MTATFWALLAVLVAAVIGIVAFIAARKARRKTPSAGYDRTVPKPCMANGHNYRIDDTTWRRATRWRRSGSYGRWPCTVWGRCGRTPHWESCVGPFGPR